jgi:hypothetical protein
MGYKMFNKTFSYLLLPIIFLSFISCKDYSVESPPTVPEYYWAGGNKVDVTVNRRIVIGVYANGTESGEGTLQIYRFILPQNKPLRYIISQKGLNPDSFEWLSFGYLNSNGSECLPTNQISFKLKNEYTLDSLKAIIQSYAVFDTTNYGTIVLKVTGQDGNVFEIANKIYESGIAEYCSPSFIAQISFDNYKY